VVNLSLTTAYRKKSIRPHACLVRRIVAATLGFKFLEPNSSRPKAYYGLDLI